MRECALEEGCRDCGCGSCRDSGRATHSNAVVVTVPDETLLKPDDPEVERTCAGSA